MHRCEVFFYLLEPPVRLRGAIRTHFRGFRRKICGAKGSKGEFRLQKALSGTPKTLKKCNTVVQFKGLRVLGARTLPNARRSMYWSRFSQIFSNLGPFGVACGPSWCRLGALGGPSGRQVGPVWARFGTKRGVLRALEETFWCSALFGTPPLYTHFMCIANALHALR